MESSARSRFLCTKINGSKVKQNLLVESLTQSTKYSCRILWLGILQNISLINCGIYGKNDVFGIFFIAWRDKHPQGIVYFCLVLYFAHRRLVNSNCPTFTTFRTSARLVRHNNRMRFWWDVRPNTGCLQMELLTCYHGFQSQNLALFQKY